MDEHQETLGEVQSFTEQLLGTLGRTVEAMYTATADDEAAQAMKAWTIFSVVMMLDFGDSALALSRADKRRGILPLSRAVYEYYITLAYFDRHRELAVQQLQTVYGRRLMRTAKGPYETKEERAEAKQRFADWSTFAKTKGLNEYSGSRKFQPMAFEVEGETEENHPSYATRYGIPSMFEHPDGAAVPDVIRAENGGYTVLWRSESMDPTLLLTTVNDILVRTVIFMKERFNASLTNYEEVLQKNSEINRRVLEAKGIDVDSFLGEGDTTDETSNMNAAE